MKKVLLLADINSSHTRKWATGIRESGYEVMIVSLSPPQDDWYTSIGIALAYHSSQNNSGNAFRKLNYLQSLRIVRKAIAEFKPDILHAHYATSYGLLGALSGFHPFIISAWGSDIFEFPNKSFVHKYLLKYNLNRADIIFSSSVVMKNELKKYSNKKIEVVPFGIDTDIFLPKKIADGKVFTIGIVKSLETIYGIDILIDAFARIVKKYPDKRLRLEIAGAGTQESTLKKLATSKGENVSIHFKGKLKQEDVPVFLNTLDLFVCPSRHESFGVSVLEASSCEIPVIVTNTGGLPEVVVNDVTGKIVKPIDPDALASGMSFFIDHPDKAVEFGKNGRRFVQENYDWKRSVIQINDIYSRL